MTYLTSAQLEAIAQVPCPVCKAPQYQSCGLVGAPRRAPHPQRVEFAKRRQAEMAKLNDWKRG